MFSTKQNIIKPFKKASENKLSPFIKPEMEVVKPGDIQKAGKVEKEASEGVKDTLSIVNKEKNTFFAAKPESKESVIDEETKTKKLDKEQADSKQEQIQNTPEHQSSGKGIKTLKGNTTNSEGTKAISAVAPKPLKVAEKGVKKEKAKEKEAQEETQVVESDILKAPTKPEDDPAFQAQIKATENIREEKSKHPEASKKVAEQEAAGHASPAIQANKNDQQAHAVAMSATSEQEKQRAPFTPESFKEKLKGNLKDLEKNLPRDAEGAKKFKEEKPITGIKENISSQVTSESDKLAGPLKNEADKPAPTSGAPVTEAKPLPVANAGKKPKPLNAKATIPKPKMSQEISMEKESQSLDNKMAENNVTDEQLAKSNEPEFIGALEQKNQAQTEAKLAPVKYRKKEGAQLGAAQNEAKITSKEGLAQMQGAKELSENNVLASQNTNKTSDKTAQEKIFAEFEAIYNETKKTVADSLQKLSEDVDAKFSKEAENAQNTFEKNVEEGLDNIYGWTVIDDWIFGEDKDAIDKLFVVEKNKFKTTMDRVLDDISVIIANGLNTALDAIEEGKKKSKIKFDSLDASQKKLGKEAFNDFNDQYTELEDTVYQKQDELASGLAKSYKENVDALQAKFDEIKESVSAGWIGGALNAITGVIETIKKLGNLIATLLVEIQNVMGVIMEDPIGFVGTLFDGVGKGIDLFKANIQKHLLGGFVTWITGALGPVGITIPDNLFSLPGIFNLVMQVLGLSWDYVRKKSVKLIGEPMVNAMETGSEVFKTVKEKGVAGIWEQVQDKFADLKETIIDSIKDMLITQVIEAGIKWLLSLLIPGAGFIKAIMAIKDLIVFFVESAIMLIPSLIQAIKSLASGNVSGVSKAIEKGLASLIPLVIGLFAKLIGLGGLVKKVQKIIKKVRKRIDRAINKMIKKAKEKFKGLVKKGKAKVKKVVKKLMNWWGIEKKFKAKDGESHRLFYKGKGKRAVLTVASDPTPVDVMLNHKLKLEERKPEGERKSKDEIKQAIVITNEIVKIENSLEELNKKETNQNKKEISGLQKELDEQLKKLEGKLSNIMSEEDKKALNFLNIYLNKQVIKNKKPIEGFENKVKKAGYLLNKKNEIKRSSNMGTGGSSGEGKNIPMLTIDDKGYLREHSGNKPPHTSFKPDDLEVKMINGVYKLTYRTKYANGEGKKDDEGKEVSPTFEISLDFDSMVKKVPDATEERTILGKDLSLKEKGGVRGFNDSVVGGKGGNESIPGFDNAHLVGDQFGGSGYNEGLNIYPSSSTYNKKEMKGVEDKMATFLRNNNVNFFNMRVGASLKDDTKVAQTVEQIVEKATRKEMKEELGKIEKTAIDEQGKQEMQKTIISTLRKITKTDIENIPAMFLQTRYHIESNSKALELIDSFKKQENDNAKEKFSAFKEENVDKRNKAVYGSKDQVSQGEGIERKDKLTKIKGEMGEDIFSEKSKEKNEKGETVKDDEYNISEFEEHKYNDVEKEISIGRDADFSIALLNYIDKVQQNTNFFKDLG